MLHSTLITVLTTHINIGNTKHPAADIPLRDFCGCNIIAFPFEGKVGFAQQNSDEVKFNETTDIWKCISDKVSPCSDKTTYKKTPCNCIIYSKRYLYMCSAFNAMIFLAKSDNWTYTSSGFENETLCRIRCLNFKRRT